MGEDLRDLLDKAARDPDQLLDRIERLTLERNMLRAQRDNHIERRVQVHRQIDAVWEERNRAELAATELRRRVSVLIAWRRGLVTVAALGWLLFLLAVSR